MTQHANKRHHRRQGSQSHIATGMDLLDGFLLRTSSEFDAVWRSLGVAYLIATAHVLVLLWLRATEMLRNGLHIGGLYCF